MGTEKEGDNEWRFARKCDGGNESEEGQVVRRSEMNSRNREVEKLGKKGK